MIRQIPLSTITASGTNGSATGSLTTNETIAGKVIGIHIDYGAGQASTTDVVVSTVSPAVTILTVTDSATDAWYYPRVQVHGSTGSVLTYDGTRAVSNPIAINDRVTVSVTGANDEKTVQVTLVVEE
jgi:hypothetical protein